MKKYLLPVILVLHCFLQSSCKQKAPVAKETLPQFNNQLTAEEKAGGVMTPEIMWKFGRLGTFALSPDGSTFYILLQILIFRAKQDEQIFLKQSATGGNPVQLTTDGGSSPQWINNGKSIALCK